MAPANLGPGQFLELLFEDSEGWLVIAAFPGDGKFNRNKGPVRNAWFRWPNQKDQILSYILPRNKQDLYVVPMLFETKNSRTADNAKVGRVLYADADTCPVNSFAVEPTIVAETSAGRRQCYWVVTDGECSPELLSQVSRRIAHAHANEGCDPSGWDIGQLLRIPGTTNNKPGLPKPYKVRAQSNGAVCSIDQVKNLYPVAELAQPRMPRIAQPDEDDLPALASVTAMIDNHPEMNRLFHEQAEKGQRSERMWRLLSLMSRAGFPLDKAFVAAKHAGCNKYGQDNRPDTDLWKEVVKAYHDPLNQHETDTLSADEQEAWDNIVITVEGFDEEPEAPKPIEPYIPENPNLSDKKKRSQRIYDEDKQYVPTVDADLAEGFDGFLSDIERTMMLPRETVVDRYVNWARTRTDAAAAYQRAGVLTVLSTVFGDFAYPATKFHVGGLNLWFMVLGGTTRSRKSTARGYMLKTLEALQSDEDSAQTYVYDLGSDVTAEGLSNELVEYPGRSKLFHRDEVHGLFGEVKGKGYLAGLKESLTELYDGNVRGKLRASGDKRTKSARTVFNIHFSGITEDVTTELTPRDFASGFLTRFLFYHAEPPPRTRASVYMEQAEDTSGIDPKFDALVDEIGKARSFWEHMTEPGKQAPMGFTREAWDRLNDFVWQITENAETHQLAEMVGPAADRMTKSTLKLACLLAMAEKQLEVGMPHVIKAVSLAEEWYSHLITIAGKVRESEWQRQQDLVTEALAVLEDPVSKNKLYTKVRSRFKVREFDEILDALHSSNVIKYGSDVNGTTIKRVGW